MKKILSIIIATVMILSTASASFATEEIKALSVDRQVIDGISVETRIMKDDRNEKIAEVESDGIIYRTTYDKTTGNMVLEMIENGAVETTVVKGETGISLYSAAENSEILFSFSLPNPLTTIDFQKEKTTGMTMRGNEAQSYEMVSPAFVFEDIAYVPLRDIANLFGAGIDYHENDRIVEINGDGKKMLLSSFGISPSSYLYNYNVPKTVGTILYEKDGTARVYEEVSYFNVNDRAYLPLRSVLELFGFQVDYDHDKKMITIRGAEVDAGETVALFDGHRQKMIQAFADLESVASVKYSGTWKENEAWPVEAVQRVVSYPMRREITYDVVRLVDGAQFRAVLKEYFLQGDGRYYPVSNGGVMRNLTRINAADGTETWINLIGGTGGTESYFDIGNLELFQLGKYQPMDYEVVREDGQIAEYRVSRLGDTEKDIRFQIDEKTGKVISYTVGIEGMSIELAIHY